MFRKRLLALASVGAVVGALGTGATQASSAGAGVSFTFQPGVANLVAHYTVSPTGHAGHAASNSAEEGFATKWPKGNGAASLVNNSGGVNGSSSSGSTSTVTPAASASFIGLQSSSTTCNYFGRSCNPPDMAVAASPSFVFQGVNTSFEVLDPSGNVLPGWPVNSQQFFNIPDEPKNCDSTHQNQPFTSDPRAIYDAADGRFWAAILQIEGAPWFPAAPDCPFKSVYYIAVTQTSDPNGAWNVYEFDMSMASRHQTSELFGADYTQIGINSQAVYFSGNMFGSQGGFYAEVFEANKAQMEAGKAQFTADGFFNLRGTGPGTTAATGPFLADTVQPTMNLDNSTGTSETFVDTMDGPDVQTGHFCGFFGGQSGDTCSGLVVWTMADPIGHDTGGSAPTFGGALVPSAPFLVSRPSDQPSCNRCIDSNDLRIPATPVVRSGVLYTAWGTSIGASTPGIEWEQITLDGSGQAVGEVSSYYNLTGSEATTYPALMPDAAGNVTMLFEHMGHLVFPETRFIVKGASDANFSGSGQLLKAGESSYRPTLCGGAIPVCRWGDYEAASFDGSGHIWFAGQYANQFQGVNTPPAFGRNWGTWIGGIAAS
ncbi:MAG TPA: hypothetical protein VFR33_05200 [Candidatus Dormibacteraeota bacterium]|nr:hypothetical protein [Candidatus Dormibacteraeota bacterium]